MTNPERRLLERVYNALGNVPRMNIGSGTASSTVEGFVGYASDMAELIPWVRRALKGIALRSDHPDRENPEPIIRAIEAWIRDRRSFDWKHRQGGLTVEDFYQVECMLIEGKS